MPTINRDRAGRRVLAAFKANDYVMPWRDFADLHAEHYGDKRGWNGWLNPKRDPYFEVTDDGNVVLTPRGRRTVGNWPEPL
jgi:hypothetical protein